MKNAQETIGDFIRLNSESLNNMQKAAPEVAKVFAEVMKQLAIKYGNIPLPTTQTTSSPIAQSLDITKEMMLDILGDVINKEDKHYIIDKIRFEDEFGDSFGCTIHLTELTKKRRKTLEFKLGQKLLYYVIPYANVGDNYYTVDKLRKESEKDGLVVPMGARGKETNIHNILSSMPFYKFKINGKAVDKNYSYFRRNTRQINIQKQEWSIEYGFSNEENKDERIFVYLEDIVDYLFNFEFNAMLYDNNSSKKIKCESLTYLVSALKNAYIGLDIDFREEFIGTKIFFNNDLVSYNSIGTRENIKKFWEVTKITENKKKRKTFEVFHPETSETKSIYLDLDDLEKVVKDIYSGYARISGQNVLIQSKFDNYTIEEFFPKLRTYSEFEWQGVTNPYIYQFQNYHYDSDRFQLRKWVNKEVVNGNIEILNNLKTPTYIFELLEKFTFSYSYYNDRAYIDKLTYMFNSNSINYKGKEIQLSSDVTSLKTITYLEVNNNQDSFYNKFSRKLQDLPISLGDCFMYNKNFEYPEQEAEIYIFKNFENSELIFEYRPGGKNLDYQTKKIDVDKFVKDFYVDNSEIYQYQKEFLLYQTDKVQEFLVGESYPFVIAKSTNDYKIISRKSGYSSIEYTILSETIGEITGTYYYLSLALNPENIKEGDDVVYIGNNKLRKDLYDISNPNNDTKRLYVKEIRNNLRSGNELSSATVTLERESFNGLTSIIGYSENLFDFSKVSASQTLTNTTQQPALDTTVIENLEVWNKDLGEMNWDEATEKVKELGEGWRLPTKEEFENILYPNKSKIPNLQDDYYWSSSEKGLSFAWYFRFYHGGSGNHSKSRLGYVLAVRDLSSSTTSTQDTYGLKAGDDLPEDVINKWPEEGLNFCGSSKNHWTSIVGTFMGDRKIESFKMIDGALGFLVSGTNHVYLKAEGFKEFLEEQTNPKPSTQGVKQRILTIPELLSKDFNLDYNTGNRTGPSQSASELRVAYENTQYENELKNTYFVGNDGNWYRLKEDSRGTWTWKKDEPPFQTSTINKQYNSMSQEELKQRYKDTQEAMTAFDEDDEEYKELKLELETLDLYIE